MLDDYMSMDEILVTLSLLKLMFDNGNSEIVSEIGDEEFYYDNMFEFYYRSMNRAAEKVCGGYSEEYESDKWYFSDPAITEYYKMAYKLGRLKGIRKSKIPYINKMKNYFYYAYSGDGSGVYVTAHEGNKNPALVVYTYENFCEPAHLAEYMHKVMLFYKTEVEIMKREWEELTKQFAETRCAA